MFTTVFAIVVSIAVIGFSLVMAGEIHDYMTNHNTIDDLTVFE